MNSNIQLTYRTKEQNLILEQIIYLQSFLKSCEERGDDNIIQPVKNSIMTLEIKFIRSHISTSDYTYITESPKFKDSNAYLLEIIKSYKSSFEDTTDEVFQDFYEGLMLDSEKKLMQRVWYDYNHRYDQMY